MERAPRQSKKHLGNAIRKAKSGHQKRLERMSRTLEELCETDEDSMWSARMHDLVRVLERELRHWIVTHPNKWNGSAALINFAEADDFVMLYDSIIAHCLRMEALGLDTSISTDWATRFLRAAFERFGSIRGGSGDVDVSCDMSKGLVTFSFPLIHGEFENVPEEYSDGMVEGEQDDDD